MAPLLSPFPPLSSFNFRVVFFKIKILYLFWLVAAFSFRFRGWSWSDLLNESLFFISFVVDFHFLFVAIA